MIVGGKSRTSDDVKKEARSRSANEQQRLPEKGRRSRITIACSFKVNVDVKGRVAASPGGGRSARFPSGSGVAGADERGLSGAY
jgi:hypothetical protein